MVLTSHISRLTIKMKNGFEINFALRMLKKNVGHSVLCVAIVALSLATALVALTFVYNVSVKPLNFTNGDRWVQLTGLDVNSGISKGADTVDAYLYEYIKENNTVFEQIGAMRAFSESRVSDGKTATRILSAELTPHIFEASGIEPLLGRTLRASDANSNEPVAVISYRLWKSYFAGDESVIGKVVNFDERPMTVVGVMPQNTVFGMRHDVWLATQPWKVNQPSHDARTITPIAILKQNVTFDAAQQDISRLVRQVREKYPDFYTSEDAVAVSPFRLFLVENAVPIFYAISAFTVIVVMLGLVNITNLLTSRALERQHEFAVRGCLGSTSFTMLRQFLVESAMICLLGAIAGIAMALVGMQTINTLLQNLGAGLGWQVPPHWLLRLDGAFAVVTLVTLAVIWLCCALVPLWRLRKGKLADYLSNEGKGTTGQSSFNVAKLLVGIQVIASCFLLVVSGSLLNSILHIVYADYGIEEQNRYVVSIEFPWTYRRPQQRTTFINDLETELRNNAIINDVATVTALPHAMERVTYNLSDRQVGDSGNYPSLQLAAYTPNAFDLLGIDIIAGRPFDNTDTIDKTVVIIDQQLARTLWPNTSSLGKQIQLDAEDSGDWYTVVGVTESVLPAMTILRGGREHSAFIPITRAFSNELQVVVSATNSTIRDVYSVVRDATAKVDSRVAVYRVQTMQEYLAAPTIGLQMIGEILLGFALVAVTLAVIGIFAIMSRSVILQARYIGIRRALGSTKTKVLWLYLRQGLLYLVGGAALGGGAALLVNRSLARMFSDLMNYAPTVFAIVACGLGLLIAVASLLPANKILRDEPGDTLHQI